MPAIVSPDRGSPSTKSVQKETQSSSETPKSGLERLLDSLEQPTEEESKKLFDEQNSIKAELEKAFQERRRSAKTWEDFDALVDEKGVPLRIKESNRILKELLPQVVENIKKILDTQPNIDGVHTRDKEFLTKRASDLKKLLSFDFVPVGREPKPEEQRMINFAFSVVYYMTDKYVGGMVPLYEKGIEGLTYQAIEKNPEDHTSNIDEQRPHVAETLSDQGHMVHRALEYLTGMHPYKTVPRIGAVDGTIPYEGRSFEALTYFARRVDPQYYMDREDQMFGLLPGKQTIQIDETPVVVPNR